MRAIAIDGPAGAGKSTVARRVAEALGWLYVDTGAMYRALALKARRVGVDPGDADAFVRLAQHTVLDFDPSGTRVLLDGEDVSAAIRSAEITAFVRFAARVPGVRAELVGRQRALAARRPAVMEGRDIGFAVLPDARWKYFLTAGAEERAARRAAEMRAAGDNVSEADILLRQRERDAADEAVGPLRELKARALAGDGVTLLDTTGMSPEEAARRIVDDVRASPTADA